MGFFFFFGNFLGDHGPPLTLTSSIHDYWATLTQLKLSTFWIPLWIGNALNLPEKDPSHPTFGLFLWMQMGPLLISQPFNFRPSVKFLNIHIVVLHCWVIHLEWNGLDKTWITKLRNPVVQSHSQRIKYTSSG